MQPDDAQRLRESLAKALRYAEAERHSAMEWRRAAEQYARSAKRARTAAYLSNAIALLWLVWTMVWGFNR